MASLASQVNQQLYHADLLLQLQQQQTAVAVQQALDNAAVNALYAAYRLFLLELADSCKLRQPVQSSRQLQDILQQEQRSHASVEMLLRLEADGSSWLATLLQAHRSLLGEQKKTAVTSAPDASHIGVTDITCAFDAPACLALFKQFVADQRAFLQEW